MIRRQHDIASSECPCGSGAFFTRCCEPYLTGTAKAPTAEALMRSRYSAYVTNNQAYLLASWHRSTRPSRVRLDEAQRWLGLRIKRCSGGSESDQEGRVEFIARYKVAGQGHRLHEDSHFLREDGQWYYVDGHHL